jgi:hypothetical protein
MLEILKFVKGAVSTKEFVPALTHFRIKAGRITGYNGRLSISGPIPLDIDCCPKAEAFVKAIEACTETAQLHLTDTGRLAVRSGRFRAHVDTIANAEYPEVEPEGAHVAIDGELLPALRMLYEFTAEDASRPWAAGVLLDGDTATATNNVVAVQKWLGYHFPYRVNLPRYAIKEMTRIGEEPTGMRLTANSATFFYEGERWLRTQLNALDWPDINGLLDRHCHTMPPKVPDGFFEALLTLDPFVDDSRRVFIDGDLLATTRGGEGASVQVPGMPEGGASCFNLRMLSLLQDVATHIDFDHYPDPVPLYGDRVRGAIAGIRL